MATIARAKMRVAFTISGNAPLVLNYPEAASQSFKAGDLVYLVSGKVTICSTDPSAILGVAADDATGTTNTSIGVYIPTPDIVWEGNATSTTVITDVGRSFGVVNSGGSDGKWYIDQTETNSHRLVVIGLSGKDKAGDTYGRYLFQFEQKYLQLQATS